MRNKKLVFMFMATFTLNFSAFPALSYISTSAGAKIDPATNVGAYQKDRLQVDQLRRFANMTPGEFGILRGKKLNFFERISFRFSQHRMKMMLKSYDEGSPTTLEKISWLFKGLILGPIALILGYIFLKDEQRELIKWIWFGFIGFIAFAVIILLTL